MSTSRNSFAITIEGVRPLLRRLDRLPLDLRSKPVRAAATFAMTPVLKAAKRNTPVGTGKTSYGKSRPHLKDTLKKKTKLYRSSGTIVVTVGHDYRTSPHAVLVQGGTRPHLVATSGQTITIGSRVIRGPIHHPGAKPNPYLEDALRGQRAIVKGRFIAKFGRDLEKQIKKAAMR